MSKCKAQRYAAVPEDCSWPDCNCDPETNRVITGLEEAGWLLIKPNSEDESSIVANWMVENGYVTGHGNTIEGMLEELVAQITKSKG